MEISPGLCRSIHDKVLYVAFLLSQGESQGRYTHYFSQSATRDATDRHLTSHVKYKHSRTLGMRCSTIKVECYDVHILLAMCHTCLNYLNCVATNLGLDITEQ